MNNVWCFVSAAALLSACGRSPAVRAVNNAAEALGGKNKILAVGTLMIEGEGTNTNLGQNLTPTAPQVVWKVTGFTETVNPKNGQMRLEQMRTPQFPSAEAQAVRQNMSVDGDVAWDVDESGKAIRMTQRDGSDRHVALLHYPITAVRAALDPNAKPDKYRDQGTLELLDFTAGPDTFTLAIDKRTKLPVSVTSHADQPNLGDVAVETSFSDYENVGGLKLPKHIVTKVDQWVLSDIRVSKNTLNAPVDLAAPAPMKAELPAPANPPIDITAEQVAPGIWWLGDDDNYHSVLFEFSDHLTLFEAPVSEARTKALIEKAHSLAFGKPLTELIVSHHHFDRSIGIRTAVAEGMAIITQSGNVSFFKVLIARPHTIIPDELAMSLAHAPLQIKSVDDKLVLKDDSMELDLFHVLNNTHSGAMLMGWVPRDRILIQADLYDSGWAHDPWADNLRENVEMRKLNPDKDVPLQGKIENWADVLKAMASQK